MDHKERRFVWALGLLSAAFLTLRGILVSQLSDRHILDLLILDSDTYYAWAYSLFSGSGHPAGPFWLGPGYPLFLAGVMKLSGSVDPAMLAAVQGLFSCAAFVLLALTARKQFGKFAAWCTVVLALIYAPWLCYDGAMLSASWILFLNSAILYLLIAHTNAAEILSGHDPYRTDLSCPDETERKRLWVWGVAGGLCALSAMARPSMLLFALPLVAAYLWKVRFTRRAMPIAVFLLALIVVHTPVSIRNVNHGGNPFMVTASGGVNFYIGNRAGASGIYDEVNFVATYDAPTEAEGYRREASKRLGHDVSLAQASGYWQKAAIEDMLRNPGEWIALEIKKLWWTLRNEEQANNLSFEGVRSFASVMSFTPLRWGILFPLAMAGVVLLWRQRRSLRLYCLYGAAYVLTNLIFFSSSEYRFPLILVLLPLAGAAIHEFVAAFRAKESGRLVLGAMVYLVCLLFANFPSKDAAFAVSPRKDFANLGTAAMRQQRYPEAVNMFSRALAADAGFQEARLGLADALWAMRNFDEAREEYTRAGLPAPDEYSGGKISDLADTLRVINISEGDSAALEYFRHQIPFPESLMVRDIWLMKAKLEAGNEDYLTAMNSMLRVTALDPVDPEWPYLTGEYARLAGLPKQADSLYGEAIRLWDAYAPARVAKAFLALEFGNEDEAVRQSRELDKIDIRVDSVKAKADSLDRILRGG
jgi:tetratricopeptide (TPR) repeat protein